MCVCVCCIQFTTLIDQVSNCCCLLNSLKPSILSYSSHHILKINTYEKCSLLSINSLYNFHIELGYSYSFASILVVLWETEPIIHNCNYRFHSIARTKEKYLNCFNAFSVGTNKSVSTIFHLLTEGCPLPYTHIQNELKWIFVKQSWIPTQWI